MTNLNEMNGTELVAFYNALAINLGLKETKKFKDLATGIARIEKLMAAQEEETELKAAKAAKAEAPAEEAPKKKAAKAPAKPAKKAKKVKAEKAPKEDKPSPVVLLVKENTRRPGTRAWDVYNEMENFLKNHKGATRSMLIKGTSYDARDYAWDLARGNIEEK
jgi:hypothetical protein